jgi:pyruvate formate lyase activating enzyme
MKGLITSVQRLSTHDGPGIRTVIFLKGCNMSCPWCHNPESISPEVSLGLVADKCRGCGKCTALCPAGALSLENGKVKLAREICTKCLRCVGECFSGVFSVAGEELTPRELAGRVFTDKPYFVRSQGGVTFSGGEPFFQPDFLLEAAGLFNKEGINVIVETNLSIPLHYSGSSLNCIDYFMVDLKMMNDTNHKRWTGIGNKGILDNILALDRAGAAFELRTPVIKGVNDSPEEIGEIARFAGKLKSLRGFSLIPYHPLGLVKYRQFQIPPLYAEESFYDKARLEELRQLAATVMNKGDNA